MSGGVSGPRLSESSRPTVPILSIYEDQLQSTLALLLQAREFARDAKCDPWTLGVDIRQLRQFDVQDNVLKWLILKGYAEHRSRASDCTAENGSCCKGLEIDIDSLFTLTDSGDGLARDVLSESGRVVFAEHQEDTIAAPQSPSLVTTVPPESHAVDKASGPRTVPSCPPEWDGVCKELWFESKLIKRFKLPSMNQEIVLTAFQEDSWALRIDDPLPPAPNQSSQTRLGNTIKALNRNQKNRLLRFRGDGTGQGVIWEPITEQAALQV